MAVSTKNSALYWEMTPCRLIEHFWKHLASDFRFYTSSAQNTRAICSSEKLVNF